MGTLPPTLKEARDGAQKDLFEIQQVFDKYGVRLFLTFGALLGIYRDGNFIPYDDDIDLCIVDPISYETRKRIGHTLLDIGYMPQPISFNVYGHMEPSEPGYNGDEASGIIVCEKRIRTTLFFYRPEACDTHGVDMVCFPKMGSVRLISTPARFFEKPGTITFKGKKFLTPSPIDEYLAFTYGTDWKKPIKGKHALQFGEMHPGVPNLPVV